MTYREALKELVKCSCPQAKESGKYCDECVYKKCNATAKQYVDKLEEALSNFEKAKDKLNRIDKAVDDLINAI